MKRVHALGYLALAGFLAFTLGSLGCNSQASKDKKDGATAQSDAKDKGAAPTDSGYMDPSTPKSDDGSPRSPLADVPFAPDEQPADEPKLDLGAPLVDNPRALKQLTPGKLLFMDPENKQVVLVGRICNNNCPLEFFASLEKAGKAHETIVAVDVKAFAVHAALLALGAKPGHTAKFEPKFSPSEGPEIEVLVRFKDKEGKVQTARAQEWIRDIETKKAVNGTFVFAGSRMYKDPETQQELYMAEGGEFVCVSNFSTAMIDLVVRAGEDEHPVFSSDKDADREFDAFTDRIPPMNTPVTLILKPKLK